jgi:hypothetical protein
MAAKLTILTHKIVIQLHLVAESCTIYTYRSRRLARKLLDTLSYMHLVIWYILTLSDGEEIFWVIQFSVIN